MEMCPDVKEPTSSSDSMSRRKFMATTGLVAASGILASSAFASSPDPNKSVAAPPLPWPWVKLDTQEAGERAFRNYHAKGG